MGMAVPAAVRLTLCDARQYGASWPPLTGGAEECGMSGLEAAQARLQHAVDRLEHAVSRLTAERDELAARLQAVEQERGALSRANETAGGRLDAAILQLQSVLER